MKKKLSLLLAFILALSLTGCGNQNTAAQVTDFANGASLIPLAVAADSTEVVFTDVLSTADYAEAVEWCYAQNLMNGTSANTFDPEGTLTRSMMATVIYRAAGSPTVSDEMPFSDAQAGAWYSDAVIWANEQGIIRGYGNSVFGINDPVSVEQLQVILNRYLGKGDTWVGDPTKAHSATRAQVAVALMAALKEDDTQESEQSEGGKILVAYFSRTGENYGVGVIEKGNTEIVAEMIADKTGADLFEIETVNTYPNGYEDTKTIAQQELAENARPELKATAEDFDGYDVIFLGYPIWYGDAPMAVYTFLESYDFTGKTVVPFCTHAGSGLSSTENSVRTILTGATVLDGLAISGATAQNNRTSAQSSVDAFLNGLDVDLILE